MNKTQAKNRIEKLKKVINHHRYFYHVLDKQELSDAAFDSLKHELYELEQQYPDLLTPDSPTQRVGGKPLEKFEKVRRDVPMLSIEDIFDEKELEKWQAYLQRLMPAIDFEYFCELKIDGFGLALIYENGILIQGITRGDGRTGEDVTQNIKTIESIPLKLELHKSLSDNITEEKLKQRIKQGKIEIRGEVYMEKADFQEINEKRVKNGEKPYANPRNLAAGSIRQLDPIIARARNLKFLAYDIPSDTSTDIKIRTHSQKHSILLSLGFKAEKGKVCKKIKEIIDFWQKAQKMRQNLPFQVDGVVISVNSNALFDELGVAGKSPRAVRALKFQSKQAATKIKDIKVQVGRTGAITPVAILEPVTIAGATITRATLHNEDEINRLGVKIGDTVIIERAGDVIPAVVRPIKDLRDNTEKRFHFPRKCPVCGAELIKPKDEVIWRCPNKACPARKNEFLEHFVSKKGFNIEGLGPKVIQQLTGQGLIIQPSDLFELREGDLIPLERFAQKSAKKLVQEIQKTKKIPLNRFIYAMGIRYVGEETAIDLAERFRSIDNLKRADLKELEAISDVGTVVAESLYKWFREKRNIDFLKNIEKAGIQILLPSKRGAKLAGRKFIITGKLDTISRETAYAHIRDLGGNCVNSISKNTDFLVVGKEPGSKLSKARKLGLKIISEEEFLRMIT